MNCELKKLKGYIKSVDHMDLECFQFAGSVDYIENLKKKKFVAFSFFLG